MCSLIINLNLKVSDFWMLHQQILLGKDNYVTDCLSRSFVSNLALGVDYTAMAASQATSEDIQAYRTAITTLKIADIPVYPSCPSCYVIFLQVYYERWNTVKMLFT